MGLLDHQYYTKSLQFKGTKGECHDKQPWDEIFIHYSFLVQVFRVRPAFQSLSHGSPYLLEILELSRRKILSDPIAYIITYKYECTLKYAVGNKQSNQGYTRDQKYK